MRLAHLTSFLVFLLMARSGLAQTGGNVGYGQTGGKARAEQHERAKRTISRDELPSSDTSMYVDASVLLNRKADEFVAIFGLAEEGESVEACQARMDATVLAFTQAVKPLGIGPDALFVDFTAQTKIYKYNMAGELAREVLSGFELKKTVAIRFRDKALIDRLVIAASRAKVYDLVKVDYVVNDLASVHDQLAEEAARVIKSKTARLERLLGTKLRAVPQVIAERSSIYYPADMYNSYTSGETENVSGGMNLAQTTVQNLRKSRTFYYDPLDGDGFDRVIDPVILEPVVQFTVYLKLKYEIENRR